jgi:hypothetical protein
MGWFEGLLTGYMNRSHELDKQKMDEAVAANEREARLYSLLLDSPDEEFKRMAATGMIQSAAPRRKKSGLQGWFGEMESNPIYPRLQQYMQTPKVLGYEDITHTTTPQQAGWVATPPNPAAPAALPATETTTPGEPGPTPVQPGPPTTALPDPNAARAALEPPAALAAPPPGPPAPPPLAPSPGASLPGQVLSEPPPLVTHERRPVIGLPQAFPTTADRYAAQYRGQQTGKYESYVDMFRQISPTPEQDAAALVVSEHRRAAGIHEGEVRQDENGNWVQDLYNDAGQVVSTIKASPKAGRQVGKREEIAASLYGKPGEDPRTILTRLTPREHAKVLREEGIIAAESSLRRAEAMANAPLAAAARAELAEKLNTKWQTRNTSLRTMQEALNKMEVGLNRYADDPLGASQAVLVTFQKLLDPNSVVRESEYDRSAGGLAIIPRAQGMYERYIGRGWDPVSQRWVGGGAGVPEADLRAMAETARQFLVGMANYNDDERSRIMNQAMVNRIDPALIFGGTLAAPPPPPAAAPGAAPEAAPAAAAAAGPAAATSGPAPDWTMVNGVLHYKGKPY